MHKNRNNPESPVALVTGAALRIGAAIVTRVHAAGYRVVLHYHRSESAALALASTLNAQRPDSVRILPADLLDKTAVMALAQQALDQWQRVDLLVNNASMFYPTPLQSITSKDWDNLSGSNAVAPLWLAQQLAPALSASQGCIVNITDSTAELGVGKFTPYTMAKAALSNMTRSLARELAPTVRVNAVAPGVILWPEYAGGISEEEKTQRLNNTALGCAGTAADIAEAVLFLANASYITGQVLRVDGGAALYHH